VTADAEVANSGTAAKDAIAPTMTMRVNLRIELCTSLPPVGAPV
jgi:hypothetical protein